jgi:hypothetical protein
MKIKFVYDRDRDVLEVGLRGKHSVVKLGTIARKAIEDMHPESLAEMLEKLFSPADAVFVDKTNGQLFLE